MIELLNRESFALTNITGWVLFYKHHKDNTFSVVLDVNELATQFNEEGFTTQEEAREWALAYAYQEDEDVGKGYYADGHTHHTEGTKGDHTYKQTMFEAICRAQNDKVRPDDYGFDHNDYEALYHAVQRNGHLMMEEEGQMFRDKDGRPVYLFKECGFDTPEHLQLAWKHSELTINTWLTYIDTNLDE